MIQARLDANESIETQKYAVTTLGRMVDRYALSLESEARQKFYRSEDEMCL